jgi:hypothetical protein
MVYTKPYKYTERELLEAEIADLKVDLKCAIRDGLIVYAEEVVKKLESLEQQLNEQL